MYRAGHLIRRSSVRLKSLSGGHSNLLMIISQIREVRATFKAFVAAQSILSEDLLKWSTTIENEALRETFAYLSEFSTFWTEVQKEFVDSLKHFKRDFDSILEGEKHVSQAKQALSAREEIESDLRRELRKASKKASMEEIGILRDRLSRTEKAKELAHMEVVDRVRENEAVRMIRVKDGLTKFGTSYINLANKANIIFQGHKKVSSDIPDVHDKALHNLKYRGNSGSQYVQETKDRLRIYQCASPSSGLTTNENSYHDPPPPYSPASDKMSDLSKEFSCSSLNDSRNSFSYSFNEPCAPSHSMASLNCTTSPRMDSPVRNQYRSESPQELPSIVGSNTCNLQMNDLENDFQTLPIHNDEPPLLELTTNKPKKKKAQSSTLENSNTSDSCLTVALPPNTSFFPPPPYNPFYEWSSFPPNSNND